MEQIFSMHVSQNWVLKRGQQKGMFLKAIVFFDISVRCPFSKIQKIMQDWNLRQMNMVYTHYILKIISVQLEAQRRLHDTVFKIT